MRRVIFALLLGAALAAFAWTMSRFIRAFRTTRAAPLDGRTAERWRSVLTYFFGQKKVAEEADLHAARGRRFVRWMGSKYHVLIFWGFLIITLGTAELFVQGLFPSFSLATVLPQGLAEAAWTAMDVSNVVVLALIGFAFFRRVVLRPRLIPLSRDATIILGAIAFLMVTHLGYHGLSGVAEGGFEPGFPISRAVGLAVAGAVGPETAEVLAEVCYWAHVATVLLFLNYLAYSKHSHILAALPNIYFRELGQRGVLPKLNLEADDIAATGVVSKVEDFTWKSVLDSFACTECARCTNACPAYNTGKPLSPMQVVHDLRDDLRSRMPDRGPLDALITKLQHGTEAAGDNRIIPLIGERTTDEVLWSCTTCGACQEVCPVFIDQPGKILEMRRNLVLVAERVPPDLARTYKNLEQNGNPWGLGADRRLDWAEGLDVPTLDDRPDAEYLLWVGCAGAFDDRIKKQTRALVEVLRAGGVDFAVLGLEEGCTGDPARRTGNEMLYQMQAQTNVETMNAKKVRKVVTACPHCLHTIKNEYPQLGGHFEVRHHTQLIRELIDAGKLSFEHAAEIKAGGKSEGASAHAGVGKITFHDPCYLGRWNGEYDAPRDVLDAALPARDEQHRRLELDRSRENGFCCGAGGGRMWMEEKIGTRVNHNRVDEIVASGADTVATACPFCTIMLVDGVADRQAAEKVQVLNVSELVARSLKRKKELVGQAE